MTSRNLASAAAARSSDAIASPVVALRVAVVAERFGEPAAQHRDRRLHFGGNADHVEVAAAPRRAGIILDLERGAHRLHQHDALQLDRQRGDGEFDVLEFFARFRPFALARMRPAPATAASRSWCRSRDWRDPSAPARAGRSGCWRPRAASTRRNPRSPAWLRAAPDRRRPWLPGTCRAPCRSARDRSAPAGAGPASPSPSPRSAHPGAR